MSKKILIVEDDTHISKLVKYNLEKEGYTCFTAITGEDAISTVEQEYIDLMVLDIMLPKMDGLEVCKLVRQMPDSKHIPIIMLTAKGEEVDKVVGFELGADDYMVKPFSPRELLLRIKAILRRREESVAAVDDIEEISIKNVTLNTARHKVFINKKEIPLTAMEFKLLFTLMQRKGRVQSRDVLLNDVWDMDASITTRTIDTHIKRLRKKMGRAGSMIETVRGIGYTLNE